MINSDGGYMAAYNRPVPSPAGSTDAALATVVAVTRRCRPHQRHAFVVRWEGAVATGSTHAPGSSSTAVVMDDDGPAVSPGSPRCPNQDVAVPGGDVEILDTWHAHRSQRHRQP